MTYLVERLAQLRRHLDHLRELRPRVTSADAMEQDLSLHNDVLFSLDMRRVVEALDDLDSIERFHSIVSRLESEA